MATEHKLSASGRKDEGKGASRRLRRLENKVPAVLYGGDIAAQSILLSHNAVIKALETESIYSSVFDLVIDGKAKAERVILKALQRHPFRALVMHMDLQRVSASDILVRMVPIHFINEDKAPGIVEGGVINHTMTQVEVRCEARYLPEFIELDLANLGLNDVLHLTNLVMPTGVQLAVDPTTGDHDHPVVSIHLSKAEISEESAEKSVDTAEGDEADEAVSSTEADFEKSAE
jgi:large subunit ribosomal protein L25